MASGMIPFAPVGHAVFAAKQATNPDAAKDGASLPAEQDDSLFAPRVQEEDEIPRPAFEGDNKTHEAAFYDDFDVEDSGGQYHFARNCLAELGEQEQIDVDAEGNRRHGSMQQEIDQAAASLATGCNFTNGLPIQPCLELAAAEPTGRYHNDDKGLKYYQSKKEFPKYEGEDKGFLAHQISAMSSIVCRMTGCTLAALRSNTRKKTPEVHKHLFQVIKTTGVILGDTMGLDKTHTTLMVLDYMANRGFLRDPVLLICPDKGVLTQWVEKSQEFS
ncbi:hypothetical protein PG988_015421 [Apiospora saccharicola]